jgi:hemerythrin superfamily protein
MDAIKFLDEQHREIEDLFDQVTKATTAQQRQRSFERIADALAVHATIEEKIFYPSVRAASTNDLLIEATEEHLAAKRLIADLIALPASDPHYAAKLNVLCTEIQHHIKEERRALFPKVKKLFEKEQLSSLGEALAVMTEELRAQARAPRYRVPDETTQAAELI